MKSSARISYDGKMSSAYVEHEAVVSNTDGPSRTRQEFADDCDINVIMAQYEKTGVISHVDSRVPMYLDLTMTPTDLMEAMSVLDVAEAAFMSLPAKVRREFDNDPVLFVEFAADPANLARMREWGLAAPEKVPDAPQRVEVVSMPAAPAVGIQDAPKAS